MQVYLIIISPFHSTIPVDYIRDTHCSWLNICSYIVSRGQTFFLFAIGAEKPRRPNDKKKKGLATRDRLIATYMNNYIKLPSYIGG